MEKDKQSLVEASWELFLKTGDPFYFMAKNTFEDMDNSLKDKNTGEENKTKSE